RTSGSRRFAFGSTPLANCPRKRRAAAPPLAARAAGNASLWTRRGTHEPEDCAAMRPGDRAALRAAPPAPQSRAWRTAVSNRRRATRPVSVSGARERHDVTRGAETRPRPLAGQLASGGLPKAKWRDPLVRAKRVRRGCHVARETPEAPRSGAARSLPASGRGRGFGPPRPRWRP